MKKTLLGVLVLMVGLLAFDCGSDNGGSPDAGLPPAADSGTQDSGTPDAGLPDAGTPDAGTPDSGTPDSGTPDSGTPDSGTPDAGQEEASIDISGYTFSPSELTVDPGTVITVTNSDSIPHTLTSESADDDFTPGAVNGVSFDTGTLGGHASTTFTIPGDAPSGTVIPFYCAFHTSMMSPANGHITVR
jgi:plastocyanin